MSLLTDGTKFANLEITEHTLIEILSTKSADDVGPAVDIKDIQVRNDGQVRLIVEARDKSGIKSVEAYCDDMLIGKQYTAPYVFVCRPKQGWHTLSVLATDASLRENTRVSFKRTVEVNIPSKKGINSSSKEGEREMPTRRVRDIIKNILNTVKHIIGF